MQQKKRKANPKLRKLTPRQKAKVKALARLVELLTKPPRRRSSKEPQCRNVPKRAYVSMNSSEVREGAARLLGFKSAGHLEAEIQKAHQMNPWLDHPDLFE